jgi:hypothetical protein
VIDMLLLLCFSFILMHHNVLGFAAGAPFGCRFCQD